MTTGCRARQHRSRCAAPSLTVRRSQIESWLKMQASGPTHRVDSLGSGEA